MDRFKENRDFMKSKFMEDVVSDQKKQLPQPSLQKSYGDYIEVIELPQIDRNIIVKQDIHKCILDRKSHREYTEEPLSLEELSYLLWATQGVKDIRGDNYATVRPVASTGARHPFETYLAIQNVKGLKSGVYRYLALEHKLLFLWEEKNILEKITSGTLDQKFAGTAAVNFIWSCLPYRGEWRYDKLAHKVMLIDAGHVCHGLYIACESLGLGTCAIAAYDQNLMDDLVKVDGKDEFVVYMASVGKV